MITLEVQHVETLQESVDRLRDEVEELRASRERLVLARDADRRDIERALHEGVQQQLVALAVNLQLAGSGADDRSCERRGRSLDELGRDVQQALDEAAQLAQRIYPPLLEAGGLAAALRTAALSAGSSVSVEVTAGSALPARGRPNGLPVLSGGARAAAPAKVTVREETRKRSPSRSPTRAAMRRLSSTGCATASRRSAAG